MKASIITIGDELLIGQVIDTNSAWISDQLSAYNVEVEEILSIKDEKSRIIEALDRSFAKSDIVLMTGGLGPTEDDVTKSTLCEYFDDEMYFDEACYNRIQRYFDKIGKTPLPAHKRQCFMPQKATLLRNDMGSAPGMLFKKGDSHLLSMPGVPYEMKFIFENEFVPFLRELQSNVFLYKRTIKTVGKGESQIASEIADIIDTFPEYIKIAYLPGLSQVRVRISGHKEDQHSLEQEINTISDKITNRLGKTVFGFDEETLPSVVGGLLRKNNLKISFAESCTGGYVSSLVTEVPGASDYFEGSYVCYSYAHKEKALGVKSETLLKYGAVSEETVIEMAKGCLAASSADIAISISGIAGPGGGTEEKPVGTIWLAISSKTKVKTKKLSLGRTRDKNIKTTAIFALNLLRNFIREEY